MTKTNPSYYKDENGNDLFDEIEEKYTTKQVIAIYGFSIKKYIKRFKGKNGLEDLKKARVYSERLSDYLEVMEIEKSVEESYRLISKVERLIAIYASLDSIVGSISDDVDDIVSVEDEHRFTRDEIINETI